MISSPSTHEESPRAFKDSPERATKKGHGLVELKQSRVAALLVLAGGLSTPFTTYASLPLKRLRFISGELGSNMSTRI